MSRSVKIVALLSARPGRETALQELLYGMAPLCRAEPGCLRWDVWRDRGHPGRSVLDELYVDDDAVSAHRLTAHFARYLTVIGDLAERTPFVLDPAQVA